MSDLGLVKPGSTIYLPFHSFSSDDPSASITLTGLALGDIQVYKDGSMTQRASTSGFTLLDTDGIDLDSTTGLHGISIDLSDDTTADFWKAGSHYMVAIASVTIDAATVNFWRATFTIGYPGAILDTHLSAVGSQTSVTLNVGPAEASALVGCPFVIHDKASSVQLATGFISAYAVTTKVATLAAAPTFTIASGDNISVFLPSPSVTARLPSALLSGRMDSSVGAMAANVVTATAIASNAITAAKIASDAITASKIAADAIGASELASDAVAEIQSGLATASTLATVDANVDLLVTGEPQLKYMGPEGPGVYLDDAASNTNTTVGTDGTVENPVSTLAAARTIADALGCRRYYVGGRSSFTLAATHQDWHFVGLAGNNDNTINLGATASATDVDGSLFERLKVIGTQAGSDRIVLIDCAIDDAPAAEVTTLNPLAIRCSLEGDFELDANTDHILDSCYSGVAGNSTPVITFNASGGSLQMRHYSGGIELKSLVASNTVSIETDGQVIFNADCNVNANVTLRGMMTVTDNTAGMNNLTQRAVWETILDDGAGGAAYDRTTSSLQEIRDRGDVAWITGGGGGITQSLNLQPVLPTSIDLANTATVRLGLILTNALDDLPSTSEITPGTISIDRKAIGGTSWSSVISDSAMSEQAGMVYFDEVFDSGTGYAEGDSIRVTFKSVSITADSNTHEVVDANGIIFQTEIRATMRGTDGANTTTPPTAAAIRSEIDSNSTQLAKLGTPAADISADIAAVLAAVGGLSVPTAAAIADAVLDEATAGHSTAGTLGKAIIDILEDTGTTLPATLSGLATAAALATHDGKLDTAQTAITAIKAITDALGATAAGRLALSAAQIIPFTVDTVTNGHTPTATEFQADDITEATADHFNGRVVIWSTGALAGQATSISDYAAVGGIGQFTTVALTEAPADDDTGIII